MLFKNKILDISELKKLRLKFKKKRIVLCHGVFDLLHVGHINHFQEAKNYGDILVVTITSDKFVNKGPNRPAFDEQNRLKAIAALNCVDYVALNKFPTAIPVIKELKPNVYCKGPDYKFHKNDLHLKMRHQLKNHQHHLTQLILLHYFC